MENLSFLLQLCLHIRASLEGGEALRISLSRFAEKKTSLLHFKALRWLEHFDQTEGECCADKIFDSQQMVIFFHLIGEGLRGHSIYERIKSFEEDIVESCHDELQRHLDKLPYLLMIPLLLLLFPAYMLLLLGPILNMFINELN